MITNPTHAPTQQDTWRRREQEYLDHNLRRVWVPDEAHADGEDNDVTAWLRKWRAGVAERVAVVRGIANRS